MFNLKINNFRSFKNQEFNFSRINILIGENSGGKSSLLKFLLTLKQTLDNPNEVNLKLKGDYTDLGNYEEVVFLKKKKSRISMSFSNKENYFNFFIKNVENFEKEPTKKTLQNIIKVVKELGEAVTKVDISFSSKLDDHSTIKTILSNEKLGTIEITLNKVDPEDGFREIYCDLIYNFHNKSGELKKCIAFKEGFFTLLGIELKNKCEKETKSETEFNELYYSLVYLLFFQNFMIEQIDRIRFVNPIGNSPKRFYFQEDKKATYNLIDIETFINIIGDPSLSKREYKERLDLLNSIIKEFGIAEEIQIVKDDQLPILALNVKTKDFWSNITDVGYGVSLQIPILFQAMLSEKYTRNGQTILIEQPEVHLHPSLQAKFIDTLMSLGSKNTYFIETHSEHIIRKLQVLIKNKEYGIKSEDVSIHYFKRTQDKFEISEHKILETGKLSKPFPSGFYDASYSLVKELL